VDVTLKRARTNVLPYSHYLQYAAVNALLSSNRVPALALRVIRKGALTKGIETRQAQRKTGYSSAYVIAQLYADFGDADQAFRWLNTAYQERDFFLFGLKTDFLFDPLRSDPRFSELVRKVGLPQ
jgi:hypothetical protein